MRNNKVESECDKNKIVRCSRYGNGVRLHVRLNGEPLGVDALRLIWRIHDCRAFSHPLCGSHHPFFVAAVDRQLHLTIFNMLKFLLRWLRSCVSGGRLRRLCEWWEAQELCEWWEAQCIAVIVTDLQYYVKFPSTKNDNSTPLNVQSLRN